MPQELTLRPGKRKWLGVGAICVLFVVAGAWMVAQDSWQGWLGLALGGPGLLFCLIWFLPGVSYLRLCSKGFRFRSLFRTHTFRWNDVGRFSSVSVLGAKLVAFDVVWGVAKSRPVYRVSRKLTGHYAWLPDTYGMTAPDLADLMNGWAIRHYSVSTETDEEGAPDYPPGFEHLRKWAQLCAGAGNSDDCRALATTFSDEERDGLIQVYVDLVERDQKPEIDALLKDDRIGRIKAASEVWPLILMLDYMADVGLIPEPAASTRFIEWDTRTHDDQGDEW